MSELKARLRTDLTAAMKAKDKLRLATLRMILAAIQTEEVSGKEAHDLTDDDVLKVLAKEAKKRGESAEIYTQNGRGELAANEHAEAQIINEYLPTPLTDEELATIVDTAIAQVAEDLGERPAMKQMGQVMKIASGLAAGKADGSRLSKAVKDRLECAPRSGAVMSPSRALNRTTAAGTSEVPSTRGSPESGCPAVGPESGCSAARVPEPEQVEPNRH